MNIKELLDAGVNVSLVVSIEDLREFAEYIYLSCRYKEKYAKPDDDDSEEKVIYGWYNSRFDRIINIYESSDGYYKTPDICRMVDISSTTLLKFVREGKLKVDRRYEANYYNLQEVKQVLETHFGKRRNRPQ